MVFFVAAKGPKRPFFGPKCPFLDLERSQTARMGSQQVQSPLSDRILLAGMLNELTMTYWAYISAVRAPKGLFGPDSFSFVAPLWAEFHFGRTIGMWGVQSVAMERPAHRALFQPIWNHPAGENGQKRKFGVQEGLGAYLGIHKELNGCSKSFFSTRNDPIEREICSSRVTSATHKTQMRNAKSKRKQFHHGYMDI